MDVRRVAVIGAGPCGLATAKYGMTIPMTELDKV